MALVMYQKTHKGMEEAKERKHRLAARTHTALMLVVGAKPAPLLAEQWRAIGAPPDVEEVLVRGGFIELAQLGTANADTHTEPAKAAAVTPTPGPVSASDAQRFLEAELFMEQTVMSTSGLRSYF